MSSISQQPSWPGSDAASPSGPASSAHTVAPGDIAVGVVIGRTSEYFDFFVYGIASSLVFPTVFFPFASGVEATLYSFMVFALAFIARPFGTVAFMALQRRYSRSFKLTAALFLLGTSTACIAFLPGYNDLGASSIVLLSVFRVLQGIALGGSWDGLPSLLALSAPKKRRGWYASLGQLGAPVGFILAGSLFAYLYASLPESDFLDWGWRYPFYVAFAINVVALFARLRLVVTDEYATLLEGRDLEPSPAGELLVTQGAVVMIGAFASLASYALFHLVTVFPLSWITLYSVESVNKFLLLQVVGAFLCAGCVVFGGAVADQIGRKRMLGALAVMIAVFSGFAPTLLGNGIQGQAVFILLGFGLLGLSYGQAAGAVTDNFEARYRYTGAALTNDFAWLIGSAFAPLVALGLASTFGLAYVGLYLLSGAVCTLGALSLERALVERD